MAPASFQVSDVRGSLMMKAKVCPMAPHKSVLYLTENGQFQTEQRGETRSKVSDLKNKPGSIEQVGEMLAIQGLSCFWDRMSFQLLPGLLGFMTHRKRNPLFKS